MSTQPNILTQMHIEAARNSTDDFNLFHDKCRWDLITSNPFGGPIALGFQMACLVEDQVRRFRQQNEKDHSETIASLGFANYELLFAGVVRAGDEVKLNVKSGKLSETENGRCYANRVAMKANGKTVLLGFKRETEQPLVAPPEDLPDLSQLCLCRDRSFYNQSHYFLKRKYMIVGNAKNFLCSAFAEQSDYIDEFADRVNFPETYPLSLISSALLERAKIEGRDLVAEPMVYTRHRMSIDRLNLGQLHSGSALNILVAPPRASENESTVTQKCVGLLSDQRMLFCAEASLAPLSSLIAQ